MSHRLNESMLKPIGCCGCCSYAILIIARSTHIVRSEAENEQMSTDVQQRQQQQHVSEEQTKVSLKQWWWWRWTECSDSTAAAADGSLEQSGANTHTHKLRNSLKWNGSMKTEERASRKWKVTKVSIDNSITLWWGFSSGESLLKDSSRRKGGKGHKRRH